MDALIIPVGGGGLLSGLVIAAKRQHPNLKIFGAEPIGADDAKRSFDAKQLIPQTAPNTIADGLLTSVGQKPWPISTSGCWLLAVVAVVAAAATHRIDVLIMIGVVVVCGQFAIWWKISSQ